MTASATLRLPLRLTVSPGHLAAGIALLAVAALPPLFGSFASFVGARIAVVAIIGLSVTGVTGYCGQLSLMAYSFAGLGVFTAAHAMSSWGWPFWLASLAAAIVTVPASVLVGLVAVRLRGFYFAIATLTFASAGGATVFGWESFTGGQQGLTVVRPVLGPLDLRGDRGFYLLALATALLLTWAVLGLQHSRIGRAMYAVRENEIEAQALGINVMKTKLGALLVSGLLAGVGGAYQEMLLELVTPTPYRTPYVEALSVLLVLVVVVGGMRSAWGPFLGASVIYLQQEVFRTAVFLQYFVSALAAVLFLYVLLKAPPGRAGGLVEIARHQAALIRAEPRRHGPRVALALGVQLACFYAIVRWAS